MHPLMTEDPVRLDAPEYPPGSAGCLDLALPHRPTGEPTVETALSEILDRGAAIGTTLDPGYQRLWAELTAASRGGKRVRPALLEAGYRAWGGTDARAVSRLAAAIELMHTALVIHDDVIDGDERRRGRLNVSGWHAAQARERGTDPARAREYGAAAGILAGDLALTGALRAVATCPAPTSTVHRLLDLFDLALHATAAGELADVRLSLGVEAASVEETLLMAEHKTAVYSFALPLQAAAVLAEAPPAAVAAAGRTGRLLGTAFQLVDDLLGVFGDPTVTGKSRLSDLAAGKQTSLIVHARSTATWRLISRYVGDPALTEEQAVTVRALLQASGSRAFVEQLAARQARQAVAAAEDAGLPAELVCWLRSTTGDLLGRAA
ncbi:MAG: geranylgeranyl diphosphate synthase, type [Nocardioidaceae bacterium]|jgi:geranylgeranyl diphosphate synthase type II|nr:geranylgeranyl diphosphate synthase, type [Nocardioidaceae bacterium]